MSSLWTPGGEHPVDGERGRGAPAEPAAPEGYDDLSPEQQAQARAMAEEMAEVRRQVAEVPAAVIVANHAMGIYELAASHLSSNPPQLEEARLAIDAMGALVEGVEGRLGENEQVLRDGLQQLRLAFVQVRQQAEGTSG
jgi:hypothetical protein